MPATLSEHVNSVYVPPKAMRDLDLTATKISTKNMK